MSSRSWRAGKSALAERSVFSFVFDYGLAMVHVIFYIALMEMTLENLKNAVAGESTASAAYAAYATKASYEGYPAIQRLFEAASKAERVHAVNHMKVLELLGGKVEDLDINIHVGTTSDNLRAAIAGETYEFESMYPSFIADAQAEDVPLAIRSFTWSLESEKGHADLYRAALHQLEQGTPHALPNMYHVCLNCGDTFSSLAGLVMCPLCGKLPQRYK